MPCTLLLSQSNRYSHFIEFLLVGAIITSKYKRNFGDFVYLHSFETFLFPLSIQARTLHVYFKIK
jgi:hypothetical protein